MMNCMGTIDLRATIRNREKQHRIDLNYGRENHNPQVVWLVRSHNGKTTPKLYKEHGVTVGSTLKRMMRLKIYTSQHKKDNDQT